MLSARLKSEFMLNIASVTKKGSEEEGSERVKQEPPKQLKRGTCGWLDAERYIDLENAGDKLKSCFHAGKVFPFIQKVRSQQARLDASPTAYRDS